MSWCPEGGGLVAAVHPAGRRARHPPAHMPAVPRVETCFNGVHTIALMEYLCLRNTSHTWLATVQRREGVGRGGMGREAVSWAWDREALPLAPPTSGKTGRTSSDGDGLG